jgi:chromosome segregation ATPase
MPHINRIRLVNVAFNDAKSFYEDFTLTLNGKSTTYDLVNTGGKSVLLMMILQVVLPNSSLREDKPLKKIFNGGKDRTSHVLVEWLLDEGERYQYLLTGFCARKPRNNREDETAPNIMTDDESDSTGGGVEYFNYYHLYDAPNPNDLHHLPLADESGGKRKVMGFEELKTQVRWMKQQNYAADYFLRRNDYLDFINLHNLIDTEWKIIKEINSGENSIEKYFRENKTSRRLIENFLLKIIDDTDAVRKSSAKFEEYESKHLADTLIEIRDNLNRLLKDREHLDEYTRILEFYHKILAINTGMRDDFLALERLKQQTVLSWRRHVQAFEIFEHEKNQIIIEIQMIDRRLGSSLLEKQLLEIEAIDLEKLSVSAAYQNRAQALNGLREAVEEASHKYNRALAQNEYLKLKEEQQAYRQAGERLANLNLDEDTLYREYETIGFNYQNELAKILRGLDSESAAKKMEMETFKGQIREAERQFTELTETEGKLIGRLEDCQTRRQEASAAHEQLSKVLLDGGNMALIISPQTSLADLESKLQKLSDQLESLRRQTGTAKMRERELNTEIMAKNTALVRVEERLKEPETYLSNYKQAQQRIVKLASLYDTGDEPAELELKIKAALSGINGQIFEKRVERDVKSRKLSVLERYNFYVPNEEVFTLAEYLKKKNLNAFTGIEFLEGRTGAEKKRLVESYPLLPYAVLVDHAGFTKLQAGTVKPEGLISDYPVPVISLELVRGNQGFTMEMVLFSLSSPEIFVSVAKFTVYRNDLQQAISQLSAVIDSFEKQRQNYEDDYGILNDFQTRFNDAALKEKQAVLKHMQAERAELNATYLNLQRELAEILNDIQKGASQLEQLQTTISDNLFLKETSVKLMDIQVKLAESETALQNTENERQEVHRKRESRENRLAKLKQDLETSNIGLMDLENNRRDFRRELSNLPEFQSNQDLNLGYETAKSKYTAVAEQLRAQKTSVEGLNKEMKGCQKRIADIEKRISREYDLTVEYFTARETAGEMLLEFGEEHLLLLKKEKNNLDRQRAEMDKQVRDLELKVAALNATIEEKKRLLGEAAYTFSGRYHHQEAIKTAIRETENLIAYHRGKKQKQEKNRDNLENKIGEHRTESEKFADFIKRESIDAAPEVSDGEVAAYHVLADQYYHLGEQIKDKIHNWQRQLKDITFQTQDFYIKEPLNELKELNPPGAWWESENLTRQFNEALNLIQEQMEKIHHDIEVLEGYQAEFNKQCIQRGDAILDSLKKFPALSRIEVNGIKRNMVEANFSDFEPEEKMRRMENHINNIIKEININPEPDREKIAQRLSSRELLAQVTDMDKAYLKLYIVENIAEHSSYKRWENAVGSEGQSNAIYFIFAVCLISYIRLLAIHNSTFRSKKVIIADNPFGATSAPFLWEPMFNILKENDVQLIAPGHNISKELTSLFEINYLLNQEILEDNRIKIVVKDVRTEEDLEKMNFTTLKQISLF